MVARFSEDDVIARLRAVYADAGGGCGMSTDVCVTVDVEDFYDGMAVLGHDVARPPAARGLGGLASLLERLDDRHDRLR